jgi:DNA-binding CsgD family transcriptional regulator
MNSDLDNYIADENNVMDVNEIAKKFNVSIPTVYRHLRAKGVKPKKIRFNQRTDDIGKLRAEGKTYQEIGEIYGISRQRVEQIINGHN